MCKRIITSFLFGLLLVLLAACGHTSSPEFDLPPLPEQTYSASIDPVENSATDVIFEDKLENGLKITVFANGELLLEGANIEENLKNRTVFKDYVSNIKTLHIGTGVQVVGNRSFDGFDMLENIVIGEDVREIGYAAFSDCTSIKAINFGNNLDKIGDYAFDGCTSLKDVLIPDSVSVVGSHAFNGCASLRNAVFGAGITEMGTGVFDGCTQFTDFRTASNVPPYALQDCATIISVTLDSTVTKIGDRAFSGCKALKIISYSPHLELIGNYAFANCTTLAEINIESCHELSVGDGAFSGCTALISVRLPEGAIKIGELAFANDSALEKMVLPSTLKSVGYGFLRDTSALRELAYRGTMEQWSKVSKAKNWNETAGKSYITLYNAD